MKRNTAITKSGGSAKPVGRVQELAEGVAAEAGLELVDVEWKGTGGSQLLRISIDKPEGVTHADCELMSRQLSAILDAEDPVPGAYQLEVSSPGVERKLKKFADWQRFTGKSAKVVLKEPVDDLKYFDGRIARVEEPESVTVEVSGGRLITFGLSQVERANLKFEW